MQSLLRWGIENSSSDPSAPTQPRKPVDTSLIDFMLGPSPAQQMEDASAIAEDDSIEAGEDDEDEDGSKGPKATRMQALANLEMVRFLADFYLI